jgi:membrane-associated phospholipid phosphatase
MRLGLFSRRRWAYFGVTYLYVWSLYAFTNQSTARLANALPLTPLDIAAPFWPWTGWIYLMVFGLPIFTCLAVEAEEDIRALALAFAGMATVCTLVFAGYPTTYPRPPLGPLTPASLPLAVVRVFDTPRNCFPSQHVANALLAALFLRRYNPRRGNAALLLAGLIALSTLTTKQHYFWDVLGGALVACGAYLVAARRAAGGAAASLSPAAERVGV